MSAFKSTLMHLLVLVVLAGVIVGLLYAFGNTAEAQSALLPLALLVVGSTVEKLLRAHPAIPIKDYINGEPPQTN